MLASDYADLGFLVRGARYLSDAEIKEAVALAKTGNKRGLELVRQHVCRYVLHEALQFGKKFDKTYVEDLFQQGMIGVMRAIQKFDPDNGANFLTYASSWIKAQIRLHGSNFSLIRTLKSQPQRVIMSNWNAAEIEFYRAFPGAESIDLEWMAKRFGWKLTDVELVYQFAKTPVASLDYRYGDDVDSVSLGDSMPSGAEDQETMLVVAEMKKLQRDRVQQMLSLLDERQRAVVEARLMTDDEDTVKLAELGDRFGVSRERIRQLEIQAVKRLTVLAKLPEAELLKMTRRDKHMPVERRVCRVCKLHKLNRNNRSDICGYCKPKQARVVKPKATVQVDVRTYPPVRDLPDDYLIACVAELSRRYSEVRNAKPDAA